MKNRKQTTGWLSLPASLLAICCLLVVSAGSSSGRLAKTLVKGQGESASPEWQPCTVSRNLKLEILGVKQIGTDVVEVTIKNGYKKDITAIAAKAGDEQSFQRDYIHAELATFQKLAAGASDDFLYSPSRLAGILPQVVLSAVIFSDGTSDGDQRQVADIVDTRLGMKIQLNRTSRYLERLGKADDSLVLGELRNLRRIAEDLPMEKDDGLPLSPGLEHGLRHGRAFILNSLSKLEKSLETETTESSYQNGVLKTVRHSGNENFRTVYPRFEKVFKELASRL